MEDKKQKKTTETKVCRCCDKKLPVEYFSVHARGYRSVCNDCRNLAKRGSHLEKYSIQELLKELRNRGIKGKFTYTKIETIEI